MAEYTVALRSENVGIHFITVQADSVEVRDKADNLYWSLEGKGQRLVINNDAFVFAGPSEMITKGVT
jgi:hypothetical protein